MASSPHLPPRGILGANHLIDQAAISEGRSPNEVRRIFNIEGDFTAIGREFLHGPPKVLVEQLTELTLTAGICAFILFRVESPDIIRRFVNEVAPAVHEAVAVERARATPYV